jgi:hypothetical protein
VSPVCPCPKAKRAELAFDARCEWPDRFYQVAGVVILAPSDVNCVMSGPVINGMAAIRHTPMAAAIKPYSIAVAPDSSARNFFIVSLQIKKVSNPKLLAVSLVPLEHEPNLTRIRKKNLNSTSKI